MPFALTDVVLPMLIKEFPHIRMCIHVDPNFMSDGPLPRHQYMQKLFQHDRTHVVHGTTRNSSGHRAQWLIILPRNDDKVNFLSPITQTTMGTMTYSTTLSTQ